MSDNLGALLQGGYKYLTGEQPKLQAETAETYSRIPLNVANTQEAYARVPLYGAQADQARADAEYHRLGLTPKSQIETAILKAKYGAALPMLQGDGQGGDSGADIPLPPHGGAAQPSGGGGAGIGAGSSDSQTTTGRDAANADLLTYGSVAQPASAQMSRMAQPTSLAPGAGSDRLNSAAAPVMPAPAPQPVSSAAPSQDDLRADLQRQASLVTPGAAPGPAGAPIPLQGQVQPPPIPGQAPAPATPGQPPIPAVPTAAQPASLVMAQSTAQPAPAGGSSAQLQQAVPPNMHGAPGASIYVPQLGMVVPKKLYNYEMGMALLEGRSPTEAVQKILTQRNQSIYQLASGATTPQAWEANLAAAYRGGLISDAEFEHYDNKPWLRSDIMYQTMSPEEKQKQESEQRQKGNAWIPGANGRPGGYYPDPRQHATDAREEQRTGHYDENGAFIRDATTPMERAGPTPAADIPITGPAGATPPAPAAPAAPAAPGTPGATGATGNKFSTYANNLLTHENPQGNPAARNPVSDASGNFQWMPSKNGQPGTKDIVARKYLPDVVKGMTNEQIDAMVFTPEQEYRMLQGHTADNAVELTKNGIRASPSTLFLAHYLGAAGVAKIMQYPTATPLSSIPGMEAAVSANPELQGNTTVGGLIERARKRFGTATMTADDIKGAVKTAGPGAGATPPTTATPPGATTTAAPGAPAVGGNEVKPEFAPGVPEIIKNNIENDNKAVADANQAAVAAQGAMRTPQDMIDRIPRLKEAGAFGYGAEYRTAAASLAHMLAGTVGADDLLKKFDSWNFEDQHDREAFIKEAINLATQQEAALPGVRAGVGLTALIGKGTPNLNMQGDTVHELLNRIVVGHQMTIDYANGLNNRVQDAQTKYGEAPYKNKYTQVERQHAGDWNAPGSIHNTQVYLAAANFLSGQKRDDWIKRLTDPQKVEALKIARRADPGYNPGDDQ